MKPRKPIKPSTKSIRRSPLKRMGARGSKRAKAMREIRARYPGVVCQWQSNYELSGEKAIHYGPIDFHHKHLKSQGGKDVPENLIGLCRVHHTIAHRFPEILYAIREQNANITNGKEIY